MMDLVLAALLEQVANIRVDLLPGQALHLGRVVMIHEGLDGVDRGVDRPASKQGGQGAGQESGETPQGQKHAAVPAGKHGLQQFEMPPFGRQVLLGEGPDLGIPG